MSNTMSKETFLKVIYGKLPNDMTSEERAKYNRTLSYLGY